MIAAIYGMLTVLDTLPELNSRYSSNSHERLGRFDALPQVADWDEKPVLLDFKVQVLAVVLHCFPGWSSAQPLSPAPPEYLTKKPMEIDRT